MGLGYDAPPLTCRGHSILSKCPVPSSRLRAGRGPSCHSELACRRQAGEESPRLGRDKPACGRQARNPLLSEPTAKQIPRRLWPACRRQAPRNDKAARCERPAGSGRSQVEVILRLESSRRAPWLVLSEAEGHLPRGGCTAFPPGGLPAVGRQVPRWKERDRPPGSAAKINIVKLTHSPQPMPSGGRSC